jgi:hypothetical protein
VLAAENDTHPPTTPVNPLKDGFFVVGILVAMIVVFAGIPSAGKIMAPALFVRTFLPWSVPIVAVIGGAVAWLFRRTPRQAFGFAWICAACIVIGSVTLPALFNEYGDGSRPVATHFEVARKQIFSGRSGPTYSLGVKAADGKGASLPVSRATYERTAIGDSVLAQVRAGRLGFPWIQRFTISRE